jgi:two-component system chemotaxis response regulator CheY
MVKSNSAAMFSGRESEGLVLVVDDEPDLRKVVRMTLEKAGYDVLEAEDGEKAIEEIQKGENSLLLNLIITDIRMPNRNGIDVINYYQKEWPSVPLIVLTGFPDPDMSTVMLEHGVVDYLVKPVEAGKLIDSVTKALKQRKGFSFYP